MPDTNKMTQVKSLLSFAVIILILLIILQRGCKGIGERFQERRRQRWEHRRQVIHDRREFFRPNYRESKDQKQDNQPYYRRRRFKLINR